MANPDVTLVRVRLVLGDIPRDVAALEATAFTPQGIGPVFGNIYAQLLALAKCIEELAEELA